MGTPKKFDQTMMDRVTDKVLAFRSKKAKAEKGKKTEGGPVIRQSGQSK